MKQKQAAVRSMARHLNQIVRELTRHGGPVASYARREIERRLRRRKGRPGNRE